MVIQHSLHYKSIESFADIENIIRVVTEDSLKQIIQTISIPRHYTAEHTNNEKVANWLHNELRSYGYHTILHGTFRNIVALPTPEVISPVMVVAAHYDTVPGSPGSDDNGSGIAVLLTCASILSQQYPPHSTIFILFNREEDCLLGSYEFIQEYIQQRDFVIAEAHVLEMVGYCSHAPETQHTPSGLPVSIPTTGDFLGIIGNKISTRLVESVLTSAKTYLGGFPVLGLKVFFGLEKYFPQLLRSDHAPFWQAKIPALMWTDTAEFRNCHYHRSSDTPETLDYEFMTRVTQLLLCTILTYEKYFQL